MERSNLFNNLQREQNNITTEIQSENSIHRQTIDKIWMGLYPRVKELDRDLEASQSSHAQILQGYYKQLNQIAAESRMVKEYYHLA